MTENNDARAKLHEINIEIRSLSMDLALSKMSDLDEVVAELQKNLKSFESEKANLEDIGIVDTAE